ncbi:MAG: hypothetical protein M0T74_15345 [Desulfitobacterium hafniense]|nr:hypothetical protein [Desulfitobacterium hafniense]
MTEQEKTSRSSIAWGITGAGHFLSECLDILVALNRADVFLSKAAREVLPSYDLFAKLRQSPHRIFLDTSAGSRPVAKLYTGEYKLVVIAPVTSNSIQPEINSLTPQGDQVLVHVRKIDLENINRLACWPGVILAADPEQLKSHLHTQLASQP